MNDKTITAILSRKIDHFFSWHWKLTVPNVKGLVSICVDRRSVESMLEVVNFVRLQKSLQKDRSK